MQNERFSAWIDGELDRNESEVILAELLHDEEQRLKCGLNWFIGDALRKDPELSLGFTGRVMQALEKELVVLAPGAIKKKATQRPFYWWSMAAGLAGVAVAGWVVNVVWSGVAGSNAQVVAASYKVRSVTAVAGDNSTNLVPSSDKAYLMAHQASTEGEAPTAGVVHFIRTVSDEEQGLGE